MRFAIWQSVNYGDCALGYKPGALMRHVWSGPVEGFLPLGGLPQNLHVTQILDHLWIAFQRVDEGHMPPRGYEGRSLSIGDVIQLRDDGGEDQWWTPAVVGWDRVEPITNVACPECKEPWPEDVGQCPGCGMTVEDLLDQR